MKTCFRKGMTATFCSEFLQQVKQIEQLVKGYFYYVICSILDDGQLLYCLCKYMDLFVLDASDSGNSINMALNFISEAFNAIFQLQGDLLAHFTACFSNSYIHNYFLVSQMRLFTTKQHQLALNLFAFITSFAS